MKEIRLFDSATAITALVPAFAPDAQGGFPEKNVGDTGLDRVYIEATDKAGNLSARVYSRKVEATINPSGKVPGSNDPSPLAVSVFAADRDPRSDRPATWSEVSKVEYVNAATADAVRTSLQVLTASLAETALWSGKNPADPEGDGNPSARYGHTLAYDATRGKTVMYGGYFNGLPPHYFDDTWEWDGSSWAQKLRADPEGDGNPSARLGAALAYQLARGKTVLFGGYNADACSDETWEFTGESSPHVRHAVHSAVVGLADGLVASSLSATWVGAGAGENPAHPGVSAPGVDFYVWDWNAAAWEKLGSHTTPVASCDEPAGSACTIEAAPSGDPRNYLRWGRLWFMAVPKFASSAPPSTAVNSEIHTDYIEVRVDYTLP